MSEFEVEVLESLQKSKDGNPTSITFRIADDVLNDLDEVSGMLNKTRQDTISMFIKDGLAKTKDIIINQLKDENGANDLDDTPADDVNYYLLNTNVRHGMTSHNMMLRDGVATATYKDWKKNIDRLGKNDRVFLYQNKVGIVATGVATGEVIIEDVNGDKGERHSQKLNDFVKSFIPITAKACKDVTKTNIPFLRVMTRLRKDRGEALLKEIGNRTR